MESVGLYWSRMWTWSWSVSMRFTYQWFLTHTSNKYYLTASRKSPSTIFFLYFVTKIRWGELVNWLPVCKSKSLFLKVLARLNSGIQIILWFNGIYDSKLELTKPNRLNQLLEHDKIISDQASRWKKAHFKRRSNSSFFFCKIKFHPVVMGTSDACPRQNV